MINIAIVDDERSVADKLNGYIDKYFAELGESDTTYGVRCFCDGVNFLSSQYREFDVVFMDIQMPMKNGLDVAKEFRKNNDTACLIFVTNLADMAIKGYEVDALDFVVKPVAYGDFKYRLAKAVKRVKSTVRDSIMILNNRMPTRVDVNGILYVEAIYHRIVYHTVNGDLEEWSTMRDAEKRLSKYSFSRCNSGYLVNLNFVDDIKHNTVMIGGVELCISRGRKAQLMNDMIKYVGGGVTCEFYADRKLHNVRPHVVCRDVVFMRDAVLFAA